MIATILKQPVEQLRHPLALAGAAPFASPLIVAVTARGLVPGAAALAASVAIEAGVVVVQLGGGSDGERYAIEVTATNAAGELVESEVEVVVIESSWATPDGGAPWLSIADFVARFTLDEVVRMTDPDGSGRIDRPLLVAALVDAQAIAEAEVAGRYALPLATVPRVVQLAIADIARARLYPRGAPDGVAEAAKAALRSLERIGSGALPLGLPAAEQPAEAISDAPVVFYGGRRQYPDGLAGY